MSTIASQPGAAELPHFFDFTPEAFGAWCESKRMPAFRVKQVFEWVYQKGVVDPMVMTNLSALDRRTLAEEMRFLTGDIVRRQEATDGTKKLLLAWNDGVAPGAGLQASEAEEKTLSLAVAGNVDDRKTTECVMIPSEDRRTACISSQVGCPVGCKFCASGVGGLESNLTGGRIVEQVWRLREMLRTHAMNRLETGPILNGSETRQTPHRSEAGSTRGGRLPAAERRATQEEFPRITNVVFMGMGEPLSNFGPVMHAVKAITSLWGHAISARKVTISTVGLPKAIERLAADCDVPVTLALSLHAPTDEIRRELIPWAQYSTIEQLLASCQKWFEKTGREITLEYTLLRGVNDAPEHAHELARLAKTLRANVNIIRYNEVAGMPFGRPETQVVHDFQQVLRAKGINSHIRASRGRDIAAACGQLRYEERKKGEVGSGPAPSSVTRGKGAAASRSAAVRGE
ncbi:MAG: 23S rRNA (adenine(2503)-C(2))-methyltransferase RlmN [Phycisphaerales bacterium]|nr:23S rRNA (adenine(2503)-C(2))-methyltransferase RlmN [Phycisphaerales bacterium]